MSWEVIRTKKIKCPCGKGKIIQETKSDDWNRIEDEFPIIYCGECKGKYIIKSKTMTPKPKYEYTKYYCIEKTDESRKIELDL